MFGLVVWLWACGGYRDGSWVEFPDEPATGLETRFYKTPAWTPTPPQAFAARERCPKLRAAKTEAVGEGRWKLTVRGDGLDAVRRATALLPDDRIAEVVVHRDAEGQLDVAVACASCELVFGFEAEPDRLAACRGPGRSVWVVGGEPRATAP